MPYFSGDKTFNEVQLNIIELETKINHCEQVSDEYQYVNSDGWNASKATGVLFCKISWTGVSKEGTPEECKASDITDSLGGFKSVKLTDKFKEVS